MSGKVTKTIRERFEGNGSGKNKLVDADIPIIRASAKSAAALAAEFDVSESLIYQVRSRTIWRHIQ